MTLYELDERIKNFELDVNEDGEIVNTDDLDKIEMERAEKIENVALYIKNARADRDALKAEKKSGSMPGSKQNRGRSSGWNGTCRTTCMVRQSRPRE